MTNLIKICRSMEDLKKLQKNGSLCSKKPSRIQNRQKQPQTYNQWDLETHRRGQILESAFTQIRWTLVRIQGNSVSDLGRKNSCSAKYNEKCA